jgi:hypothetical protein
VRAPTLDLVINPFHVAGVHPDSHERSGRRMHRRQRTGLRRPAAPPAMVIDADDVVSAVL